MVAIRPLQRKSTPATLSFERLAFDWIFIGERRGLALQDL